MWIDVGDTMCRVTNASEEEQDWIQRYLSFEDVGFKGKKRGRRVSMFSTIRGTFPGGLLQLVREAASRDGIQVEERDRRTTRITPDPAADLAWLRDYQRDAVEACVTSKRGIVRAPTGSGKGDMIVGVVRRLPGRWLFLVHRDNLVDQQARRYRDRTGLPANEMSRTAPSTWVLQPGLNLITLQSLAAGLRSDPDAVARALTQLDGLMIDECHVAPADVYYSAIQRCPAEYRLGFSGTPLDRTDNRSLMAIAALGKVIYSIKATTLIEAGVLAAPHITMVQCAQNSTGRTGGPTAAMRASAFKKAYDDLIVTSAERNLAVVRMVIEAEKPCMVFVKIIDHGMTLSRMIQSAGFETEFVWGESGGTSAERKKASRNGALQRLERGDSQVMVASVVLQEGVDIPSLRSVVVASGGKSIIAALQRIGRGMRTDGGKKSTFEVYDVLDTGSPMMERHARRRMNTYVREGYQTIIRAEDGSTSDYQPRLLTRRQKRDGVI